MKRHNYISLCMAGSLAVASMMSGCSHSRPAESDSVRDARAYAADTASLPEAVCKVRQAVREDRPEEFAAMVSYPLVRPYPLRDIRDRKEMVSYYPVLMDDSLKSAIAASASDRWTDSGWKGTMLDDGTVWVDDSLYAVNYVSGRERAMMRELIVRDSLSLDPSLRRGWRPVACLKSLRHGNVYRIDRNPRARDGRAYRLSMWQPGDSLGGRPTSVFLGQSKEEGSAGITTFFFAAPTGAKAVYAGDITDLNEHPRILFTYPAGVATADTVESAYWLDLVGR